MPGEPGLDQYSKQCYHHERRPPEQEENQAVHPALLRPAQPDRGGGAGKIRREPDGPPGGFELAFPA
eukprot:5301744-Pyramimonas_sp.AAC.1